MQCKQVADETELKATGHFTLGTAAGAGNDPQKSAFPSLSNAAVIQAPSQVDTAGWLGGGACFSDKSITVMGKQIVLPFSNSCNALLILRYALMVVAALVSFKIISGAILS